MSGPSARYALPESERAPIDQTTRVEPELTLEATTPAEPLAPASADAVRETAPPNADGVLGRPIPPGVLINLDRIDQDIDELIALRGELHTALGDRARHVAISVCSRIAAIAGNTRKVLERRN